MQQMRRHNTTNWPADGARWRSRSESLSGQLQIVESSGTFDLYTSVNNGPQTQTSIRSVRLSVRSLLLLLPLFCSRFFGFPEASLSRLGHCELKRSERETDREIEIENCLGPQAVLNYNAK